MTPTSIAIQGVPLARPIPGLRTAATRQRACRGARINRLCVQRHDIRMSKIRGNDCADERDSQQASVDRHGCCPRQALARRLVTRRGGARGVPCVPHVFFTGRISFGLLRLHCRCKGAPHTAELSTTEYDSRPLEGTARLDCWRDGRRTRGHSHWRWPCGPGVCGSAGLTAATSARHSAIARVRRHDRSVWDSAARVAGACASDLRRDVGSVGRT